MASVSETENTLTAMYRAYEAQNIYQWTVRRTTVGHRVRKLRKLRDSITRNEEAIISALYDDLRVSRESANQTIGVCYADIDDAICNLAEWMEPTQVATSNYFEGSYGRITYEARGIVLLFGPWNFPFNLVIQPLVAIIAAGNCALVKPNELAPATSVVTTRIIKSTFNDEEIAAFEGGVELAEKLLELPVDHIFFTGSSAVGKIVMAAAAKNLASVTLELGGKNPVIIQRDADIQDAAEKIAATRGMNSGQVCLCPENVWVHESRKAEFVSAIVTMFKHIFYRDGDLDIEVSGRIVNRRNLIRIKGYIDDAVSKGATINCGGHVIEETLSVHPTVLTDVPENACINHEEIFGPILSIFTYREVDDVYQALRKQPKPLALYIFSRNQEFVDNVLENTTSGGVTVNNCIMHCAVSSLPFGGVNHSGVGRYHGVHGFKELSHERSVLLT